MTGATAPLFSSIEPLPRAAIDPYVTMPFDYAATHTGFEGWKLSKEELDAISPQAGRMLQKYLPAVMNSPHAELMLFCGTLLGICGSKYMGMMQWQAAQGRAVEAVQ